MSFMFRSDYTHIEVLGFVPMKKLSRSRSAVTLLSVLALSACSSSDDDSFDESIVPDEPINPIAGEPVAGDCPLIGN